MANIAKLEEVLDYIRTHPEQHNQDWWAQRTACGTAQCFAGWAVVLDGYRIAWWDDSTMAECCVVPDTHPHALDALLVTGTEEPLASGEALAAICPLAEDILGLTREQSNELFSAANTIDDLERIVKDIANEQRAA